MPDTIAMDLDQAKPIPHVNVRQPTMAVVTETSVQSDPSTQMEIDDDHRDTLSPLLGHRTLVQESIESVVQPGRRVKEVARDIAGTIIRGKTRHQGGYADVAEGIWVKPDGIEVPVAIKLLREVKMDSIKTDEVAKKRRNDVRMQREAIIWETADHPNIIPLYGFKSGDDPCLVSPWCSNGNLTEYLEAHPDLSAIDKLKLLSQAGRGLGYLHSRKPPIAHGDIKPANVLVNDATEAAFCDFGLARVLQSLETHTGLTTSNQGQGSKGFQSPELILGQDSRPSTSSDVYAFGGLILAVLTGKTPFYHVKSPGKVVLQISLGKTAPRSSHPELPEDDPVWKLLAKCWEFDAAQRPNVLQIVEELELEIARRESSS